MPSIESMFSLVSDEMDLFTVLLRTRVQLADACRDAPERLAWVVHEILVRCQSGVEDPAEVLEVLVPILRAAPEAGRQSLIEALERGVDVCLLDSLVELLVEMGLDPTVLECDCLRRLATGSRADVVRALHMLGAIGPQTDEGIVALLQVDAGRLWRLEALRIDTLLACREQALPRIIESLAHRDAATRARAEAVLEGMGPEASGATLALLSMPPWEGPNGDWPSPVLYRIGDAGREALVAALEHPTAVVRDRAMVVLEALETSPG